MNILSDEPSDADWKAEPLPEREKVDEDICPYGEMIDGECIVTTKSIEETVEEEPIGEELTPVNIGTMIGLDMGNVTDSWWTVGWTDDEGRFVNVNWGGLFFVVFNLGLIWYFFKKFWR